MKAIKERCMWFIGYDRLMNSNYSEFMYSESDIVLFDFDPVNTEFMQKKRVSKTPICDMRYTIGKKNLK